MVQAELARRIGRLATDVNKWEKGRAVPSAEVPLVARALGVSVAVLYGEEPAPRPASNIERFVDVERLEGAADIPIYAWATLGPIAGPCAAEPIDWEPYPDDVEESLEPHPIGVRVRGRSMTNRGIEPGSTCYVAAGRPAPAGEVVLARVWDPQGGECGMLVKILIDTNCLESDGDDGQEPVLASRVEVIGPVISVRPPARRPRTARESTRRRRDMRSAAQRVARMLQVFEELLPEQRRILLAALQQRMAAESPGNGREQR